jgi:hypothetical protein
MRVKCFGWSDERIEEILKEARSRDYDYLYLTLKKYLDKDCI